MLPRRWISRALRCETWPVAETQGCDAKEGVLKDCDILGGSNYMPWVSERPRYAVAVVSAVRVGMSLCYSRQT